MPTTEKRRVEEKLSKIGDLETSIKDLESEIKTIEDTERPKRSFIERLLERGFAYLGLSIWVGLLYVILEEGFEELMAGFVPPGIPLTGIFAAIIVAFTFEPAKKRMEKLVDNIFPKVKTFIR